MASEGVSLKPSRPLYLSQVEEKAQEKEHLQNFPAVLASVLISILQKIMLRSCVRTLFTLGK